ncbi:lipoprotein insertase outer membrane protein LolB [Chitinimonas sp. BJYL2]|uniref:lipoprotein insertase outer membrane protein LolB n=1 Tax=Chitinimonas sp. BJYL2 TaxID=2976696 RepID=UPI0022B40C69|nr:lipoprotein insertase outer membrane protein LolB [Chitinimonas sp. BJYL2]
MSRIGLAGLLAGALLLAGCASPPPPPAAITQLPDRYAVSGKVGVNAAGKGYSARFRWEHTPDQDTVEISNPLGQIQARLTLSGSEIRFYDGNGQLRTEGDIETVSERELGWRLPASHLRYWLLGMATPEIGATWHQDAEARVLTQAGWQVRYPAWVAGTTPQRIHLGQTDLDVRIALYDWNLNATGP